MWASGLGLIFWDGPYNVIVLVNILIETVVLGQPSGLIDIYWGGHFKGVRLG